MSYYQVIVFPRSTGHKKPIKPFVDRRLYTEMGSADERFEELSSLYPEHEVGIIIVTVNERGQTK